MTDLDPRGGEARLGAPAASRRPLKIGLNLPTVDGALAGATATWSDLRAIAQLAEDVGFDSLWVPDHLLLQWENQTRGIWECWSLLAALAATTSRIEFGPLVTCTGFRNPALLAKMADAVDQISNGRLILGLGAGWDGPEYTSLGYPTDHRLDRFEEALQIIAPLLREGRVDVAGTYHQARDYELRPRSARPGGPPIKSGGKGLRTLRLTARYADIWNAQGPLHRPEEFRPLREAVDAACAEIGRDPATLDRSSSVVIATPLMKRQGWEQRPSQAAASRPETPEEMAALLRAYAREGLDLVQLWLMPSTIAGLEWFAAVLDILDRGEA